MPIANLNGADLYYDVEGSGEPLVLIPGLGATHLAFKPMVAMLATHHRVIQLDLCGVGASAKPAGPYSMEGWAEDVRALLDHLDVSSAHVLGASLGGCVAQVLALAHPRRVRSLIVTASFSEIDALLERNYRLRIALVEQLGMSETLGEFATVALYGRSFLDTAEGRAAAAEGIAGLRRNAPALYIEHLRALLRFGRCEPDQCGEPKFTARLPEIACPALVLCGEEDVLTVPKFSRLLAEQLPNATLVIQPRCGHANTREQPRETAELVQRFIAGLR